jgi:serpin B
MLVTLMISSVMGCSSVSESNSITNTNADPAKNGGEVKDAEKTGSETPMDNSIASNYTTFGIKLFSQIAREDAGKNVFISPVSIAFALAMVYNGASGKTKEAMARALELQGISIDDVNRNSASLKDMLEKADPKVQLRIANSLWSKKDITFKPDFVQRNREFYKAEVTELDFADPSAAGTINGWVSRNTEGKIEKIIDQIEPSSILFLINAIYFKGKWAAEFEKDATTEQPFTTGAGSRKQVQMMAQSGSYQYIENADFQAISLPYGDSRWNLHVFLPAGGKGLAELQKSLTGSSWTTWMQSFRKRKGEILLPRFKIEYEKELNDSLKALGMDVAFDQTSADFSGMIQSSQRAYISKVKHKTFVEVNEEGTEAAAATSAGISITSAQRPSQPFRMVVDRPFLCAIRDSQTGAVLFIGTINEPL